MCLRNFSNLAEVKRNSRAQVRDRFFPWPRTLREGCRTFRPRSRTCRGQLGGPRRQASRSQAEFRMQQQKDLVERRKNHRTALFSNSLLGLNVRSSYRTWRRILLRLGFLHRYSHEKSLQTGADVRPMGIKHFLDSSCSTAPGATSA